ncbi:hypothetical protein PsorP6_015533 [Peronosclerospora sorghi]|uniref:Uncharacterized protein n=1 Tax=Peronosclerospora sorghi TaxID=230839 RepID=A0ACC0WQK4_9STRA|nr:hypothetical protein PsorP6_015533 [Peronosclerospora sorghi]
MRQLYFVVVLIVTIGAYFSPVSGAARRAQDSGPETATTRHRHLRDRDQDARSETKMTDTDNQERHGIFSWFRGASKASEASEKKSIFDKIMCGGHSHCDGHGHGHGHGKSHAHTHAAHASENEAAVKVAKAIAHDKDLLSATKEFKDHPTDKTKASFLQRLKLAVVGEKGSSKRRFMTIAGVIFAAYVLVVTLTFLFSLVH